MLNVVILNVIMLNITEPYYTYAPVHYFQNALVNFATAISYGRKMFIKSTPQVHHFLIDVHL
jgi:hypothetical protein